MINKNSQLIIPVFQAIMKDPVILSETQSYSLKTDDFNTSLHKFVFSAIDNLASQGKQEITTSDIDTFLQGYNLYVKFKENGHLDGFLRDLNEFPSVSKDFNYYYVQLKKLNAVRDFQREGINISHFFPEETDLKHDEKMRAFDAMSLEQVFETAKIPFIKLEAKYACGSSNESITADKDIRQLVLDLKTSPEVGVNLQGDIFNTVCRGARLGKFYLRSGASGLGKSRASVGDACFIAYPLRYDSFYKEWVRTGNCEKILFVVTEQKADEIQTMILAYLSDINEEKILYGRYSAEEEETLIKATEVMNTFKDNFIIAQIPDPSIQSVKATIRKNCVLNGISYVFYDYIFSSPSLITEFAGANLREDVVLGMLSTALKDVAVEQNVFIMSATQVNGDLDNKKGIKDQTCLRGSKAIADKIDMGCIINRPTAEELAILDKLIQQNGGIPNIVADVYKLRRGRYTRVRVWSHFDNGTCRKKDLFITDENFNPIVDFTSFTFAFEDLRDYTSLLGTLNGTAHAFDKRHFADVKDADYVEIAKANLLSF